MNSVLLPTYRKEAASFWNIYGNERRNGNKVTKINGTSKQIELFVKEIEFSIEFKTSLVDSNDSNFSGINKTINQHHRIAKINGGTFDMAVAIPSILESFYSEANSFSFIDCTFSLSFTFIEIISYRNIGLIERPQADGLPSSSVWHFELYCYLFLSTKRMTFVK